MPSSLGKICLAVIVAWGFWGFFNKQAAQHLGARPAIVWNSLATVVVNLGMVAWFVAQGTPVRAQGAVVYPVLATLFAAVGFILYMSALDGGEASLVVSLTALYPGLTILLAVLFLKERLAPINLAGIALALVAGVLICWSPAKQPAGAVPETAPAAGAAPETGAGVAEAAGAAAGAGVPAVEPGR